LRLGRSLGRPPTSGPRVATRPRPAPTPRPLGMAPAMSAGPATARRCAPPRAPPTTPRRRAPTPPRAGGRPPEGGQPLGPVTPVVRDGGGLADGRGGGGSDGPPLVRVRLSVEYRVHRCVRGVNGMAASGGGRAAMGA